MQKKKKGPGIVVSVAIMAVAILAAFALLSNRSEQTSSEAQSLKVSAVQEVLLRNLETDYPASPKEVVKYYSEISRCFYGEEYTEEEFNKLAEKSRAVFDDELVANQTSQQYINALKADISSYKENKKVISSYSVSSSTDVDYYNYLGDEWAQLYCVYSIRISTTITPIKEKYLLRKDDDGHWKIFGWVLVESEES